jgi:hypothetical protein
MPAAPSLSIRKNDRQKNAPRDVAIRDVSSHIACRDTGRRAGEWVAIAQSLRLCLFYRFAGTAPTDGWREGKILPYERDSRQPYALTPILQEGSHASLWTGSSVLPLTELESREDTRSSPPESSLTDAIAAVTNVPMPTSSSASSLASAKYIRLKSEKPSLLRRVWMSVRCLHGKPALTTT